MLGQRPLGGQPLVGRQCPGQDIPADALVQLLIQAPAALFVQGIGQHNSSIWYYPIISNFYYNTDST